MVAEALNRNEEVKVSVDDYWEWLKKQKQEKQKRQCSW